MIIGKMHVRAALALVALMAAFMAQPACHAVPGHAADTLEVAIPAGPVTLDPRLATDAEGSKIGSLICEGLFGLDDHLDVRPLLASSYERLSDRSYLIRLRPDVRFSDGSSLTSEDVVYTYRSMTDGSIASPYKSAYERIDRIEAIDRNTVRMDLKERYSPFLTMLAPGIVSKRAAKAAGDRFGRAPVCAGPYRLLDFDPEKSLLLAANEYYYAKRPATPRLRFHVIKDDNIRVLKLLKGELDLVQNAIPRLIIRALIERDPGLSMAEGPGIVMAYMGLNLADPLLARKDVRRALAYGIDRAAIIKHRFRGLASPANSIVAPGNWAYDPDLMQYQFDPEKARGLLDAAGFPDPDGAGPEMRFSLVLKTSTVKERIDIARMISHQLAQVGVGLDVVPFEWGTFYRDIRKGNFQAYTLSWVGATEPDIFYEVARSDMAPPRGLNRGHYSNPEIDRLVAKGRATLDIEARKTIYRRVQEILIGDLPYIPLWYERNYVIYRKGLEGVTVRPDASYTVFARIKKRDW